MKHDSYYGAPDLSAAEDPPPRKSSVFIGGGRFDHDNPGRPFAKGNPGRPKGARNHSTLLAEALARHDADAQDLVRRTIAAAKRGNARALRLCFQKLMPPAQETVALDLPAIATQADAGWALDQVLSLVCGGALSPAQGGKRADIIDAKRRALAVPVGNARQPRSARSDSCAGSSPERKSVSEMG